MSSALCSWAKFKLITPSKSRLKLFILSKISSKKTINMLLISKLTQINWGLSLSLRTTSTITKKYLNKHSMLLVLMPLPKLLKTSLNLLLLIQATTMSPPGKLLIWKPSLVKMLKNRKKLSPKGQLSGLDKQKKQLHNQSLMMIF